MTDTKAAPERSSRKIAVPPSKKLESKAHAKGSAAKGVRIKPRLGKD